MIVKIDADYRALQSGFDQIQDNIQVLLAEFRALGQGKALSDEKVRTLEAQLHKQLALNHEQHEELARQQQKLEKLEPQMLYLTRNWGTYPKRRCLVI